MIYIIKFWRELIIVTLIVLCGVLGLKLQTAQYNEKETKLIHERLVVEAKAEASELISTVQEQRKIDAEIYAIEINHINSKYNDALALSNRVQQQVTTYNNNISKVSREAVENYAKAASAVYGECRSEYLKMGYYASKLDAELDSKTSPSN